MGITAISGPHVVFGTTYTTSGAQAEYNEERGPSLFDLGQGTADPRYQFTYSPGAAVGSQVKGLWDQQGIVDYVPFTASSSTNPAIVSSTGNAPVSGTAFTLTPIASNGAISTTIVAPETGQAVSVVAIDSTAATLNFGSGGTVAMWNPTAGTGRCISVITSCTNTNSEVYIVRGRDMYGFKMTENIIGSTTSSGTGTGVKAFKYIQSVVCSTTVTVTSTGVTVGFADRFGFPLKAPYMAGITVWNSTTPNNAGTLQALSSVNTVKASTVVTQTATTPDVRGTVNSTFVSNGSTATGNTPTSTGTRLTIYQPITVAMAGSITPTDVTAMFGATQFSDF